VKKIHRRLGLLAAAATVAALVAACDDGSDKADSTMNQQGASVMCQEFIKQDKRVKSPGSLKFSGVSSTKITVLKAKKPWKYAVRGWIDSENDFGATKRNTYTCTVSAKDADTWKLNDLTFTTHN
jgi:hypothetical protein